MDWYLAVLRKYAVFTGRAQRKELWMFALFNFLAFLVIGIIESALGLTGGVSGAYGPLSSLYSLAVLLPSIGVGIRRLHDTGRTGWWLLVGFIPVVGTLILLIFYIQDSTPGDNEYGPSPKEVHGIPA